MAMSLFTRLPKHVKVVMALATPLIRRTARAQRVNFASLMIVWVGNANPSPLTARKLPTSGAKRTSALNALPAKSLKGI